MASMKRGAMVASILMLVAIITSSCNQPYSQPPSVTNTPIDPNSLFATPLSGATQMTDVEVFASGTAAALQPTTATATLAAAGVTPQASATFTSTPVVNLPPTFTPTATLAVSGSGPSLTPLPAGSPYVLQKGEYPYCIARRFDVNPNELLALNNLPNGDIYYQGLTLKIPQTGNRFPPPRALRNRPATYTVASSDETIYGVACAFGEVDPAAIAQANGISVGAALTAGQQLKIP